MPLAKDVTLPTLTFLVRYDHLQGLCNICSFTPSWIMALPNWALTMSQLDIFFPDRLKIELN
ncbi:hypothetical protein [Wolbachia endosymbiont (group B) of Parapoynx stratiotata]|uniref:hypothetical protein n=1 Tax=Wolbachia endosymbiont (group B) of Parapoynx stratiotata TaxID=2954040 RepID=UPI002227CA5D|nr:hypothetical protein [Wolbachia endosymbiont (group B) of Parapoynx stratiotata]